MRLHRSYLLQGDRLVRIEPTAKGSKVAVLTTGARLPISERGALRLRAWLGRAGR